MEIEYVCWGVHTHAVEALLVQNGGELGREVGQAASLWSKKGYKDMGQAQLKESISLHIWNPSTGPQYAMAHQSGDSIVTFSVLNSDLYPMARIESLLAFCRAGG